MYGVSTAFVSSLLIILVLLYIPVPEKKEPHTAEHSVTISQPLTTDTWGIFDLKTGAILDGKNLDEVRPIASVSKLFTALAVMKSAKQNDAFTITASDVNTEGQSGKLHYGEMVTPYTLLFPLLIESSNDAATAIARYLGDEFSTTVTDARESLMLTHTNISEPSGLSSDDTSSVRDLARAFAYIANAHPHILDITRLKMYVALHTGYINNNPAVEFDSYIGGKHGYTPDAGKTFVGAFHTSNTDLGLVLLGSSDLKHDIEILQAYGGTIIASSDILEQ